MPATAPRELGDTQLSLLHPLGHLDFPREAGSPVGTSGQSCLAPSLDLPTSVGECVCVCVSVSLSQSAKGEACVFEGRSAKITEMLH